LKPKVYKSEGIDEFMKVEDHLRNIDESIEVIKESIQKGLQERQRTIEFNASVASVEMLEVFLHQNNIINPGTMLKHEWFSSIRRAKERLNFEFPKKEEILTLINSIEQKRNLLCYGKPQPVEAISSILESFNQLKSLFEKGGIKWN